MADTTTIPTQGHFGTVTDRIASIATQGHFLIIVADPHLFVRMFSDNRQAGLKADNRQGAMHIDNREITLIK